MTPSPPPGKIPKMRKEHTTIVAVRWPHVSHMYREIHENGILAGVVFGGAGYKGPRRTIVIGCGGGADNNAHAALLRAAAYCRGRRRRREQQLSRGATARSAESRPPRRPMGFLAPVTVRVPSASPGGRGRGVVFRGFPGGEARAYVVCHAVFRFSFLFFFYYAVSPSRIRASLKRFVTHVAVTEMFGFLIS